MTDDNDPRPQIVAEWMTPRQAFTLVDSHFHNQGGTAQAIIGRLKGGALKSVALGGRSTEANGRVSSPTAPCNIPSSHWAEWNDGALSDIWGVGDIRVYVDGRVYRYFGVRFDPAEVRQMLPPLVEQFAPPPVSPPLLKQEEPASEGKPVAASHLEEWYRLFQKAYPNASEDLALDSARGMFPGKSVTRASVRALRGTQKRGPKAKPAD